MPLAFPVPPVVDNADGWGPCTVPEHLKDIPFAPYSKGDKLGRAGDWSQGAYGQKYGRGYASAGVPVFNFFAQEEEESFHLVDNRPVKQNKFGGGRGRFQQNQRFQQQRRDGKDGGRPPVEEGKKMAPGQARQRQQRQPFGQRNDQRPAQYSDTVEIKPDYHVLEQIHMVNLLKLKFDAPEPADMVQAGSLEYYDKTYDKVSVRTERPLEKTKRVFRSVTASDDPIIQRLSEQGAGRVFATDAVVAAIMCMKSSVYGWDLLATRKGDKLFLDWRPNAKSFNLLTVNENAAAEQAPQEEPRDNMNSVEKLAVEATAINQNFSQQVLVKDGTRYDLGQPNPFAGEGGELASCAYRYRKWQLTKPDGDAAGTDIIIRCEVDGAIKPATPDAPPQLILVKAHNEYDQKTQDFRKKLENQKAAVLLSEAKNNKFKISKWCAQALLSGAEVIKLGFIARASPRDNQTHAVLHVQQFKVRDQLGQYGMDWGNCWGVLKALVERLLQLEEGKYLLVKDASKDQLRIYSVPTDAFDATQAAVDEEEMEMGEEVPLDVAGAIAAGAGAGGDAEDV